MYSILVSPVHLNQLSPFSNRPSATVLPVPKIKTNTTANSILVWQLIFAPWEPAPYQRIPPSRHMPGSSSSTTGIHESHQAISVPRHAPFAYASAATDRPSARNQHCDRRLPG